MTAALPPGPRYPRAVNTLGWMFRPGPFMERLSVLAREARLRPTRAAPERVRRRAVTWTPSAGAEALVEERVPAREKVAA